MHDNLGSIGHRSFFLSKTTLFGASFFHNVCTINSSPLLAFTVSFMLTFFFIANANSAHAVPLKQYSQTEKKRDILCLKNYEIQIPIIFLQNYTQRSSRGKPQTFQMRLWLNTQTSACIGSRYYKPKEANNVSAE